MKQSAAKIRAMISDGAVSESEGRELLAALNERKSFTVDWLWNPFPSVQPMTALGLGLVVSAVSTGLAVFSAVRFGSFLSVNISPGDVSWFVGVRDQLMAWPLAAAVLWVTAKLAQSRVRWRDLAAYLGLARLPQLILALVSVFLFRDRSQMSRIFQDLAKALESGAQDLTQALGSDTVSFLVLSSVLSLPLFCWSVVLLVNAFRAATGLSGGRLAASVVGGLVVAEIVPLIVLGRVL